MIITMTGKTVTCTKWLEGNICHAWIQGGSLVNSPYEVHTAYDGANALIHDILNEQWMIIDDNALNALGYDDKKYKAIFVDPFSYDNEQ